MTSTSTEFIHFIISILLGTILFLRPYRLFCLCIFFILREIQSNVSKKQNYKQTSSSLSSSSPPSPLVVSRELDVPDIVDCSFKHQVMECKLSHPHTGAVLCLQNNTLQVSELELEQHNCSTNFTGVSLVD